MTAIEPVRDAVEAAEVPSSSRGVIALLAEACTSCMLCARECPDWCIHIESHPEVAPPAQPGGRPRTRYALDRFAIDFGLCMYCGICIEVCPFDALHWAPPFAYAGGAADLVQESEQLQAWMQDVPERDPADPS